MSQYYNHARSHRNTTKSTKYKHIKHSAKIWTNNSKYYLYKNKIIKIVANIAMSQITQINYNYKENLVKIIL